MKQRLIILIPGFPQHEAETNCLPAEQRLLRGLRDQLPHVELRVLALHYPFRSATYSWEGIPVFAFGGRNRSGLYRRLTWFRVRRQLRALVGEQPATLLSFWYDECAALAEAAASRHGIRHVCWMRGQDAREGNRYVASHPIPTSRLLAISEAQADLFEANYGYRPAQVLPNAIEAGWKSLAQDRAIDLLGVGSLIPLKQFHLFLQVVHRLRAEGLRLQAMLCGTGPEEPWLRQKVQQLGLEDCVHLMGELPNPAVQQLMLRSKILLHPSSYEGFSTVCLEALAAGARVVAFHQPMHEPISNWHVAKTLEEMTDTCRGLLAAHHTYRSVVPFTISDIVNRLSGLLFDREVQPGKRLRDGVAGSMP